MSEMKLCQGPKCHTYRTKDRIRGPKGDKHYETRKRSKLWYGNDCFCTYTCERDWWSQFGEQAVNHFGRIHEPKRQDASGAWYKDYTYNYDRINNRSNNTHYFINDLLGQRIPITQQQYDDTNLTTPTT